MRCLPPISSRHGGLPIKRVVTCALLAILLGSLASLGLAAYPDRPIQIIVPWWAPGDDTDAIKRAFTEIARKYFPEPIVVVNIAGASGTEGARKARHSPPDGYTIFSAHDAIHTAYHTGISEVSYRDFEPICLVASTPSVLAAGPGSPWRSFHELIEDSKGRPGEIRVGAAPGSTSHFFPALVAHQAGVQWRSVSYEGTAVRMAALMRDHIDLAETSLARLDEARAGRMKLLAIAAEERHPAAPDLPTLRELGIDVVYAVNRGLMAPRGTPEAALARLEELCAKVTGDPAFAEAIRKQGAEVRFLGRATYAGFLEGRDLLTAELAMSLGYTRKP